MPRGITTDGEEMQILRVFRRPTKAGETRWFCRAGFWVKDKNIPQVEHSLQQLRAAEPGLSLSEIICQSVINEARRTQKRISNSPKSD